MIGRSVLELCRRDVDDALAGAVRDQVDETQQILTGITESHAPPDTGLEVGGGAAHIEGDHALVLVPDIDHPVHPVVLRLHMEGGEQVLPVILQFTESPLHVGVGPVAGQQAPGRLLVDDARSLPLPVLRILTVSEDEDQGTALARLQREVDLMGRHGIPSGRHGVRIRAGKHRLRTVRSAVGAEKGVS